MNARRPSVPTVPRRSTAWIVLVLSGVLEAVWASALHESHGLSRPIPAIVFFVATAASMVGLAWAMRVISTGTAYAVWTGIGATLTVVYAMITGAEPATFWKLFFLAGVVGCVIGLKLIDAPREERPEDVSSR
ncbi:quaternary ammonium compound-resistance protein SugE [Microbacterium resistens]|uniref:Quaternary ammonium compound-resistance protein SugE n=1 Tax=Microbacterium resistens TaxID=156977 RepID=A0ABU1SD76_9MICO|nr:multidrug efflux SMR transporter [Microbacterium resistens]MDR6866858.1 quaternary ammonium compound-resistance protein SugE [Microbacterium resistens]